MRKSDPRYVILRYIDAINSRDSKRLITLQTDDFTFIDYEGAAHIGQNEWHDYFTAYRSLLVVQTWTPE